MGCASFILLHINSLHYECYVKVKAMFGGLEDFL